MPIRRNQKELVTAQLKFYKYGHFIQLPLLAGEPEDIYISDSYKIIVAKAHQIRRKGQIKHSLSF
jgi:hypothetical protein